MNILQRHVIRASQLAIGEVYLLHGINAYKETIPPQLFQITGIHHDAILPYINCRWWCNIGISREFDPNRQMYISDLFKTTLELEHIPDGKLFMEKFLADQAHQDIVLGTPPIISANGR